ncbi:MAG: hypothetical protein FWC26_11180 [Fibromonadales bacterium]|nr:hypothetical protein [Fibromonadales bacterium]
MFFEKSPEEESIEKEGTEVYTEMCLLIASGKPVNADTVFSLNINKIFAYSFLGANFNRNDTVWHVWYQDSEKIKETLCKIDGLSCSSSLSSDSLREGNWSVDTRQSGILLGIRQFKIQSQ